LLTITLAIAAVLLTGPASAGGTTLVTGWHHSQIAPAASYLAQNGRALKVVGSGYQWRHGQDGQGKVYLEYRTRSRRTFTSLIMDSNKDDGHDD
jgi:hypothetical protein